ncbi:MAG: hypothetical protein ABL997_01600 [Planctomycetota bacterium]
MLRLTFALLSLAPFLDCQAPLPNGKIPEPQKELPAKTETGWVLESTQTIEVAAGATDVIGTFTFSNPGDQPVEFREINASCTCTSSTIRVGDRTYVLIPKPKSLLQVIASPEGEKRVPVTAIPIGAREQGEFELHLDMQGAGTSKSVSLDVHTTDPASPMLHLTIHALGQRVLILEPEEVDLGTLEPRAKRDFTVTARSKVVADFQIEDNTSLPANVTATWEKSMVDGRALWTLRGTYTASDKKSAAEPQSDATFLKFATDISTEKQFTIRLVAKIGRPVEVTPTFLSLGQLRQGTKRTESLRFQRTDGNALEATAVKFENLSVSDQFITATTKKDGAVVVVEITISESTPRGLVRGDIVVELDHPQSKQHRILFNGFVR